MIKPNTEEAYRLLHNGILALARAERQGIRVDIDYLEKTEYTLQKKVEILEKKFKNSSFYKDWNKVKRNPNIYSSQQLENFLYKIKNIKPLKTTKTGRGSTDEEALRLLNLPELNTLAKIKKLKKIKDTYLKSFSREQINGYMHPFFNLHIARTYRSSSNSPNFQNIPKRDEQAMSICRKALLPRKGHQLLEVDYSGLEVRIAACYHKDPKMLEYIHNPQSDMHADMAAQIFMINNFDKANKDYKILRAAAKNGFVFPEFYGDYYKNCAINLACEWAKLPEGRWKNGQGINLNDSFISDHLIKNKIKSIDNFIDHIKEIEYDFWNNRFKHYNKWKLKWWKKYQKTGYIDMFTGFRCSGVMSNNDIINYPVQGAAFHCLLWSFIELDKIIIKNNWNTRLIGQIHDAIILDVDPKELDIVLKTIKKVTCNDLINHWKWINVPLDVEAEICPIDGSWNEKYEIDLN